MKWRLIVAAVATSVTLGACSGATTQNVVPLRQSRAQTKIEVQWDGSGFAHFVNLYRQEVTTLMQELASEKDEVLTTVLDGQPLTTADIKTTDFAASLANQEIEPDEEPEAKQAIAAGLTKRLLERAKEVVPGSGQLQGLEMASNTPGVSRIYQWTDGVVNEPSNHFSLTDATEGQVTAEIQKWLPRLAGLKGKTVTIVGIGHGVGQVTTVKRAHRLFQSVVEGNGGHLVWTPTLRQR